MGKTIDQEDAIIESAKRVFIRDGFEKAKMQHIADDAGISRTTLNYYYRTKDNLFYSLVSQIFESLLPEFTTVLEKNNLSFTDRVCEMIDVYNDFIRSNSQIPFFIISEINRNPRLMSEFIQKNTKVNGYISLLRERIAATNKSDKVNVALQMPIEEWLTLLYGLMFMPYMIAPMVEELYNGHDKKISEYYDHHVDNVKFILRKLLAETN
ncbi:MAG: TetR/AcrR family transcriptional regulator [Paludibacteraceae bacterium]